MGSELILKIKEKVMFECRKNYGFIKNKFFNIDIDVAETTLDKIINEKASVGRFGDGELDLIYEKSLKFQDYNDKLASKLKNILKLEDKRFLVCIPYTLKDIEVLNEYGSEWWKVNLYNNRYRWLKLIKNNKKYYDSFISRFYMEIRDKERSSVIIEKWKEIWCDREVIIVEGVVSRLGIGNDLFDDTRSISRVLCPAKNAFDKYDEILRFFTNNDYKNKLILIALGPTATVLAYDLYLLGYQAIDIGHLDIEYEWYLSNATKKIKISNKYVNEVDDYIEDIQNIDNNKYKDQILHVI